jgi:Tol biopolymer transport system component
MLGGITIANVVTRKTHTVPGAFETACPVWSPDGKWIAVCSRNGTGANRFSTLEVMTPAGTRRRAVTKRSYLAPVAWSPKSDAILFLGADKNSVVDRALFILNLRNRHVARVPGTGGAIDSAAWHR